MDNLAKNFRAQDIAVWIVRLLVKISLFLLGCFVFAHLWEGGPRPTGTEWVGLSFFPIGIMLGLFVTLRYPIAGGILVLLSLAGFYAWHFLESSSLPSGPFFILFASPGLLMLASKLTYYVSQRD